MIPMEFTVTPTTDPSQLETQNESKITKSTLDLYKQQSNETDVDKLQ
jgi:hypothetical protein